MVKHIFIDDKTIWISDGKEWSRWYGFPPTESQQRNKTTDKSTEPKIVNTYCNIVIFFLQLYNILHYMLLLLYSTHIGYSVKSKKESTNTLE
jgi:hypothetical protein